MNESVWTEGMYRRWKKREQIKIERSIGEMRGEWMEAADGERYMEVYILEILYEGVWMVDRGARDPREGACGLHT